MWQTRGDVDFNADVEGVDAEDRGGADRGEHAASIGARRSRVASCDFVRHRRIAFGRPARAPASCRGGRPENGCAAVAARWRSADRLSARIICVDETNYLL